MVFDNRFGDFCQVRFLPNFFKITIKRLWGTLKSWGQLLSNFQKPITINIIQLIQLYFIIYGCFLDGLYS
jgi:hypothetical protein